MEKLITIGNVSKSYDGKYVLDHITLDLYKAQSIAFTGHNECGKRTLLKLIAGLIRHNGQSGAFGKYGQF